MLQTLVVIASIVVLAGAILTSTLVTAKNAFHQVIVAKTQTAMNDATSQFQFWAQSFAAKYGTEADWQAPSVQQAPIFQSMCGAGATTCNFYETLQWKVTGSTIGVPAPAGTGAALSTAMNMTPAVDEQRISATITAVVSDATGRTLYGGRTEEVTARVFNVSPYVVVTATRDLGSAAGAVGASEGDSGGVLALVNVPGSSPDGSRPSRYTDTVITATLDCANTAGFDEADPQAEPMDDGTNLFDPKYRSGGDLQWAYQMPCTPTSGVPSSPSGIENYVPPTGSVYQIYGSDSTSSWQKGDLNNSQFAR